MNRLLFLLVFLPCLGFAQSPKMDSSINYHYNMDDYLKYIGETILFYRSPENLDKQQLYAGFYLTTQIQFGIRLGKDLGEKIIL